MPSVLKNPHIGEAEYLSAKLSGRDKHEYVSGQAFTMFGASIRHNQIAVDILFALREKASSHCRVSISAVKFKADKLYYYPEVMVSCAAKSDEYCELQPCFVVEVLSESTEGIDRGEKLHNYQKAPELEAYLLVSQEERRVDVFQRSGACWRFESVTDGGQIELSCPEMTLTLDSIYHRVEVDSRDPVR